MDMVDSPEGYLITLSFRICLGCLRAERVMTKFHGECRIRVDLDCWVTLAVSVARLRVESALHYPRRVGGATGGACGDAVGVDVRGAGAAVVRGSSTACSRRTTGCDGTHVLDDVLRVLGDVGAGVTRADHSIRVAGAGAALVGDRAGERQPLVVAVAELGDRTIRGVQRR